MLRLNFRLTPCLLGQGRLDATDRALVVLRVRLLQDTRASAAMVGDRASSRTSQEAWRKEEDPPRREARRN